MKTAITCFTSFLMVASFVSEAQDNAYTSNKASKVSFNRTGFSNFNVETRGKIEVSDDDKDIKNMSADGYLEITKTVFGSKRSIVITPEGSGLKREYFESRTKVAFEPEGRKWLSEVLPELVRSTTIGAESRVNRFYRLGGTKGVLNELESIESDHVKAHYANLLMKLGVSTKDYGPIVSQVAESIDSDHYLTEFLKDNMAKFLQTKESAEAVFIATGKMDSDHYKSEVIKEGLRSGPASLENVKTILQATGNMGSDHYKAEVLTAILRQNNVTDPIIAELVNTTKSIDSDHYRTVVLEEALGKPGISSASYQKVIESVKEIDSDHYKSEVLINMLRNTMSAEAQLNLIALLPSIESDHYVTTVANEMLKKQTLNDGVFQKLVEAMGNTGSDHYTATFLQSALNRPSLSKENMMAILQAAGNIESDHYIAEVLTDAAPKVMALNDASVKEAYRKAAKKIESETYYGRAMKAID